MTSKLSPANPFHIAVTALIVLSAISSASAHNTANDKTHEHLKLKNDPDTQVLRIKFDNGLDVTSRTVAGVKATFEYQLVYNGAYTTDLGFSLYNIGLQGRLWDVAIEIKAGSPQFFDADGNEIKPPGSKLRIPKAGMLADGKVDPNGIWFIKFTGTCKMNVVSKRPRIGEDIDVRNSHDNVPPPPGAGGEH